MNFKFLLTLLFPLLGLSQTQIGSDIDGKNKYDRLGQSISLSSDGKTLAIGGVNKMDKNNTYCYARIYRNINNNWIQLKDDIIGGITEENSEVVVELSKNGKVFAFGFSIIKEKESKKTCYITVYNIEFDKWKQIGKNLSGEINTTDFTSISLSDKGDIIAVASQSYNSYIGMSAQNINIYKNQLNTWVNISSNLKNIIFGTCIDLSSDGNTIAIGNPLCSKVLKNSGEVIVYRLNNGSIWKQIGKTISGVEAEDYLGYSVSLSNNGEILACSSPFKKINGSKKGEVKVYKQVLNEWKQFGDTMYGEESLEEYGKNIALSALGNKIAIGRPYRNIPRVDSGVVDIYQIETKSNKWNKFKNFISGEDEGNLFGYSLSLSEDGNIIAVGAIFNSEKNLFSGSTEIYDYSK